MVLRALSFETAIDGKAIEAAVDKNSFQNSLLFAIMVVAKGL